eukprot:TRINITY_DN7314_c0_g1_i1.p2 TRINITY_DN7314_c0_g1~~TRINITY_DN7314_c0_g1_i1.p2  ORF type:complete len:198 (+),score=49.50 TRINITY_DN7314_c0_g1_i1:1124-1717(+)
MSSTYNLAPLKDQYIPPTQSDTTVLNVPKSPVVDLLVETFDPDKPGLKTTVTNVPQQQDNQGGLNQRTNSNVEIDFDDSVILEELDEIELELFNSKKNSSRKMTTTTTTNTSSLQNTYTKKNTKISDDEEAASEDSFSAYHRGSVSLDDAPKKKYSVSQINITSPQESKKNYIISPRSGRLSWVEDDGGSGSDNNDD